MIDMRGRFLQIFVMHSRSVSNSAGIADGGQQQSMDEDVGVTTNRRSEMRVKAERQTVMKELIAGDAEKCVKIAKNRGVSTGPLFRPFACSFMTLTHSFARTAHSLPSS